MNNPDDFDPQELPQLEHIDTAIAMLERARSAYNRTHPKFSEGDGLVEDAIAELQKIPMEMPL